MWNFLKSFLVGGDSNDLDTGLVERIRENLKREPSDQLHAMLGPSASANWSPEALHAARMLIDQREKGVAPEPVYRTEPRLADKQAAREQEAVAPGFNRKLLALDVGSHVYCVWRKQVGTIIRWDDEKDEFYIRFDNGEGDWTALREFM